jgi:phage tail-like protein
MDANGTKFHLLLGRDDWSQCLVDTPSGKKSLADVWQLLPAETGGGLSWNEERNELTLEPRLFKFTAAPKDTFPTLGNRRGAGRDRFGNWYWIDETSQRVRVRSRGSGEATDFWPLAQACVCPKPAGDFAPRDEEQPATPLTFSGLAITEDHYLVAGVLEPAGLLIFDLHTGGEPRRILWPREIAFAPFDLAPRPGGGVFILDRVNRSYWALDRHFNVIAGDEGEVVLEQARLDDFQPMDESEAHATKPRVFPKTFSLLASPLSLADPIAIEALPDGTVLILDFEPAERFSQIYRYRFSEQLDDEITTEVVLKLIEQPQQSDFSLLGYDMAFVPEHEELGETVQDRLYVVAADGNQSYAFRLCLRDGAVELQPIAEYLPMRLFGGKALVGTNTGAYYDFAENWIPLIQQRRPRYVPEATFETPLKTALNRPYFDAGEPDSVWHRVMLDAHIPPETTVEIWSRAANEEADLTRLPWQREPTPYLRGDGSELPFLRSSQANNCAGAPKLKTGAGTWELLFQRARGRYLQLKIRLRGDERSTPRLRALRAYYPRFSYLTNYLPSVYREDQQSASFLDRFLANTEGLLTTLEDKIAAIQILFDVRSAPSEVLGWLAGWFGVALDPSWDEARRRLFIAHAMEFFQYRGTIRGLTMALHLALDECANEKIFERCCTANQREPFRIVERYLTRTRSGVIFGDPSETTGPRTGVLTASWQPAQGRANLNQRYSEAISLIPGAPVVAQYPLLAPSNAAESQIWIRFSQATVGFVPSTAAAERAAWQAFLQSRYVDLNQLKLAHQASYTAFNTVTLPRDRSQVAKVQTDWEDFAIESASSPSHVARGLWQDFLARRYRRIKGLNQIYGTGWSSFEFVPLPDQLPLDGAPLADWFQFESVVVRMQRAAHRFTVLLPVPLSLAFNPEEHQRRLELSRRIIDLEKPAHTVFDVKFYWAMFRIGEARLQFDTVIAQGSRAPQLLPEFVVGEGFIGEGYLGPPVPEDACDRSILGRDPLRGTPS